MGKQSFLDVNKEQFKVFMELPEDLEVTMLNLVKFKDVVPETGLSGEEGYREYLKRAQPYLIKSGAEVMYIGKPENMLIGPQDELLWDMIVLVKYPSVASFFGMVQAEGYPKRLREQALEDSRLIYCS